MLASPGVTLASAAISGYQRYLSPYKGFRCAHRALHGELTCSEAVKRLIQAHGVVAAWPHVRERFAQCRAASLELRSLAMADASDGEGAAESDNKKKGKKDSDWGDCDCGDADCLPGDCDPF